MTFTSSSRDSDGPLAATGWDLDGDGAFDDATGPTASHAYRQAGRYRVAVRVRDADGAVNATSATLTVSARQPS